MSSYAVSLRRMEERPMMKALVRYRYGGPGVVRVEEIVQPTMEDDRVLVLVPAIQIAKALGGDVTAVVSTRNVELARALGADRVIDRLHEDFTQADARYDLILDVAGGHSWFTLRRVLEPEGRLVVVGAHGSRG